MTKREETMLHWVSWICGFIIDKFQKTSVLRWSWTALHAGRNFVSSEDHTRNMPAHCREFLKKVNNHSCWCWPFPYFICCHLWYLVFSHNDSDRNGPQQKNHLSLCYTEQPVTYTQDCPSFPTVGQRGCTGGWATSHFFQGGSESIGSFIDSVYRVAQRDIIYHKIACPLLAGSPLTPRRIN